MHCFILFLSLIIAGASCKDFAHVASDCMVSFERCTVSTKLTIKSATDRHFIRGAFSPFDSVNRRRSSEAIMFGLKARRKHLHAAVGELITAYVDGPEVFADQPSVFLKGKTWRQVANDDKMTLYNLVKVLLNDEKDDVFDLVKSLVISDGSKVSQMSEDALLEGTIKTAIEDEEAELRAIERELESLRKRAITDESDEEMERINLLNEIEDETSAYLKTDQMPQNRGESNPASTEIQTPKSVSGGKIKRKKSLDQSFGPLFDAQ